MHEPERWEHGLDLSAPPRGIAVHQERTLRASAHAGSPDRAAHLAPMLLIAAVSMIALAVGVRLHHGAWFLGAARWVTLATACAGLAFAVPVAARIAFATRELTLTQGVLIMSEAIRATCLRAGVRAVRLADQGRDGMQLEVEAEFSTLQARVSIGRELEVGEDEEVLAVLVLSGETRERAQWLARVVAAWAAVEVSTREERRSQPRA